jgi:hypothetical protein
LEIALWLAQASLPSGLDEFRPLITRVLLHRAHGTQGKTMSTIQPAIKPFQVAAAVIGNALEWYDFLVFGFFTVIIARLFFPSDSQYASG